MRKCLSLIIWALMLIIILSACNPSSESRMLSCPELLATSLQPYIGQAIAPEVFAKVVENAYGVPRQKINVETSENAYWKASWTYKGYPYAAWTENDGIIGRVVIVLYEGAAVKAGRLLDCVGSQPEWYSALFGAAVPRPGNDYNLSLYFPQQGIIAVGSDYKQREDSPPRLSADFRLSYLVIVSPGSIADLYKQRWYLVLDAERPAWQPVPWTEDWSAMRWVEDR